MVSRGQPHRGRRSQGTCRHAEDATQRRRPGGGVPRGGEIPAGAVQRGGEQRALGLRTAAREPNLRAAGHQFAPRIEQRAARDEFAAALLERPCGNDGWLTRFRQTQHFPGHRAQQTATRTGLSYPSERAGTVERCPDDLLWDGTVLTSKVRVRGPDASDVTGLGPLDLAGQDAQAVAVFADRAACKTGRVEWFLDHLAASSSGASLVERRRRWRVGQGGGGADAIGEQRAILADEPRTGGRLFEFQWRIERDEGTERDGGCAVDCSAKDAVDISAIARVRWPAELPRYHNLTHRCP